MAKYADAALGVAGTLTDVASGIAGIVYGAKQLEQNERLLDIQELTAQANAIANLGSLQLAANRIVNAAGQLQQLNFTGGQINEAILRGGISTGNPSFVNTSNPGLVNFNRAYATDANTRAAVRSSNPIATLSNGVSGAIAQRKVNPNRPDMMLGWENPAAGWSAPNSIRAPSTISSMRSSRPSVMSMSWDGYVGPGTPTGSVRSLRSLSSASINTTRLSSGSSTSV